MVTKEQRRQKIKARVRGKISGTQERPRLTVFRSNKQIYAQLIDDIAGRTLASASSLKLEMTGSKKEIAAKVGDEIAKAATEAGISTVVLIVTAIFSMAVLRNWLMQPVKAASNFNRYGYCI